MSTLLKQSFLKMIQADDSAADLSVASEILIARVVGLVYGLVQRAPQGAVVQAAASGSDTALMNSLAAMVITEAPAQDAWSTALLRGRLALAERLEASGGVWTAEEAVTNLQVARQTLQQWRAQGRVIALAREDGSFSYPIAQFKQPVADTVKPRPYDAIKQINGIVGSRLSPEELVALLAAPQAMLTGPDGQQQTPFAALATGDSEGVLDVVRWIVVPPDEDAPTVEEVPLDRARLETA